MAEMGTDVMILPGFTYFILIVYHVSFHVYILDITVYNYIHPVSMANS